MKRFKYLPSVQRDYNAQIDCFATCINYARQPKAVKERVDRQIESAAGEYATALKEYMTTSADWRYICTKYYISDATLDRLRRRLYQHWK